MSDTLDPRLVAKADQGEADASAALDRTIAVWHKYRESGQSHTSVLLAITLGLSAMSVTGQEGDDHGDDAAAQVRAKTAERTEILCGMLAVAIGRLASIEEAKRARS